LHFFDNENQRKLSILLFSDHGWELDAAEISVSMELGFNGDSVNPGFYFLQEILLIDSESRYAELHRRQGEQWLIQLIIGGSGVIPLTSVGTEISMSALYEGFVFPEDEAVLAP